MAAIVSEMSNYFSEDVDGVKVLHKFYFLECFTIPTESEEINKPDDDETNVKLIRNTRQVQLEMTDCQLRRLTNVENAKPACNEDGSYQSFQCDQASLPHKRECWCVHENGQMIKGNPIFLFDVFLRNNSYEIAASKNDCTKNEGFL